MPTLSDRIIGLLQKQPGLSDREITNILIGIGAPQQSINQACRSLAKRGILSRRKRSDGRLGNYLLAKNTETASRQPGELPFQKRISLSEDSIKEKLAKWLKAQGWKVKVAWGQSRGIDIEALRGNNRWIIEVKGQGSRPQMRVNYFLAVIGETLQRMDDPTAKYSIGLPDLRQFRDLWNRLPNLAKSRTGITALFVDKYGNVSQST